MGHDSYMTHTCTSCQRYTAVVDGWAMDYEADGFTPSDRVHTCGESDRAAY